MFDFNRSAKLIVGALLNRDKTWQGYLTEAEEWKKTALLLTVPLIILSALLAYVVSLFAGDSYLFGQVRPTLGWTMLNMVSAAIGAVIVAFIFGTLSGVFGGKRSFALGLAATSLAFVPGYLGQVVSQLPWIGGLLGFALFIYALVCLWKIIPSYLEVPSERRTGHYVTSLIATIAVGIVFSMTIGRTLMPNEFEPGFANVSDFATVAAGSSSASTATTSTNSVIEDMRRKQELLMAAGSDVYDPPADGLLTESQVLFYLDVMEQAHVIRQETKNRIDALAKKEEQQGGVSMGDMQEIMAEAYRASDLTTLDLQMVKDNGGNWAEHQWVQESLLMAARSPGTNDVSRANAALYQKYKDRLSVSILR